MISPYAVEERSDSPATDAVGCDIKFLPMKNPQACDSAFRQNSLTTVNHDYQNITFYAGFNLTKKHFLGHHNYQPTFSKLSRVFPYEG